MGQGHMHTAVCVCICLKKGGERWRVMEGGRERQREGELYC